MTNSPLNKLLSQLRNELQNLYGSRLIKVMLYGSQARRQALPDSDIDVLVVLAGAVSPIEEIHRVSDIVAALSLKYDRVISCVFVSEVEYRLEQSHFMKNVQREGVAV
jgi:predicted nucleotidyltransferase